MCFVYFKYHIRYTAPLIKVDSTKIHEVNIATFKTGLTQATGNAKYRCSSFNPDLNLKNKRQEE